MILRADARFNGVRVLIPALAADIRLVNFNDAARLFGKFAGHGVADPVSHEPRALVLLNVQHRCLFSSDPACRQLVYHNGFQPVYTYSPPPGFRMLGGLPVPIIVIVYDAADGGMSFGTPSFLPCTYADAAETIIRCPNNPPLTP